VVLGLSFLKLVGANRRYIEQTIQHISSLMTAFAEEVFKSRDVEVFKSSDVMAISKNSKLRQLSSDRSKIDLVRLVSDLRATLEHYEGVCW
jgi:hypothetical protein